jgi:enamine deaminase RidA (YjgF/YER057c/UK114 family)
LRIYIVDYRREQAAPIGAALREFFPREKCPASTWIGVSALAVPDFLIEIEAIAVLEGILALRRFNKTQTKRRSKN